MATCPITLGFIERTRSLLGGREQLLGFLVEDLLVHLADALTLAKEARGSKKTQYMRAFVCLDFIKKGCVGVLNTVGMDGMPLAVHPISMSWDGMSLLAKFVEVVRDDVVVRDTELVLGGEKNTRKVLAPHLQKAKRALDMLHTAAIVTRRSFKADHPQLRRLGVLTAEMMEHTSVLVDQRVWFANQLIQITEETKWPATNYRA